MNGIAEYWAEIVTVALLGTDRRDPPSPPTGGLADLAADDPRSLPAQRLLQQVAATVVVRRAGLMPSSPATALAPAELDERPITPVSATATWHRVIADWPVLEDEWLLTVIRRGWRLAPELVPAVLSRHRRDPVRHTRALVAAGPLGAWLIEWSPTLACGARRDPAGGTTVELAAELPTLAIIPEFASLLGAEPAAIAAFVTSGLLGGQLGVSHRAVLVNMLARVPQAALRPIVRALNGVDPSIPAIGLAFSLADLVALRDHMLTELEPS